MKVLRLLSVLLVFAVLVVSPSNTAGAQTEPPKCTMVSGGMYWAADTATLIGTIKNVSFNVVGYEGVYKIVERGFPNDSLVRVYVKSSACQ